MVLGDKQKDMIKQKLSLHADSKPKLIGEIVQFVLHDEPVDIDKLRKSLLLQVGTESLRENSGDV